MNFGTFGLTGLPIEFASPLNGLEWAVLAGVPVGIIALYFLKLRRRPVQVPSTLLWRKSLEDLHVNSLFQRLRKNLLLVLQLLAVFLVMLAVAGPRIKGGSAQGRRFVLAIDNSASMSAIDVTPTRLDRAKAEAKKVVESMAGNDLAMVISFADRARIVSNYTGDRRVLLRRIDAIAPTQATTSLRDALQVAAGLANPSKQIGEGVVATSVVTPKLFVYTDGGFPDVEGFSLGNLVPEVVVIGPPALASIPSKEPAGEPSKPRTPSDNVAILALQTRRNDDKPDLYQVFGRVRNFRAEAVETEARLLRHDPEKPAASGVLIDAISLKIPPQAEQSFKFDVPSAGLIELEVHLDVIDAQPLDNHAYTVIGSPRKAQVLVVTPGNRYLVDTLQTQTALERADVLVVTPDQAKVDPVARNIKAGTYDLVIYDRVRPDSPPEANALYFGVMPPGAGYDKTKVLESPVILDWDIAHPLMQYVRDLSTVAIARAIGVEPPTGSTVLIESNLGPLAFIAPREGYSDAVIAFSLLDGENFNTNWFKNISFPLFLFNSLQFLGNSRESILDEVHLPGQNVALRLDTTVDKVKIVGPDGTVVDTIARTPQGTYLFAKADVVGIYHARWGESDMHPFVVNQFDLRESDIAPRGLVPEGTPADKADAYKIKIGYNAVDGTKAIRQTPRDWWAPFAVAAMGVLLLEWYIYNRRVYV